MVPLIPGAPSLTLAICLWFLISVFLLSANFFLYLFSRCSSLRLKCAVRMQHALFSHLNIRLTFYISRWLFLVISSYLILRSRRVVNDPIRYSYCAEFGIFMCRGWLSFVWLQHQGQQICWIISLALYGTLIMMIEIPPMINQVITGLSDCWLLFPTGTFIPY